MTFVRSLARSAALATAALAAAASSSSSPEPQRPAAKAAPQAQALSTTGAGSALSRLTADPADEVGPAISPSGTQLLYTVQTFDPQTGQLAQSVIVGIDPRTGGGRTFYTSNPAFAALPAWTPDGTSIVFGSSALGTWSLVRTLSATPNAALSLVVRSELAPEPGRPSASPDGKSVAFHTRMQGVWNIATSTMDGAQFTVMGEGVDPAWSPDGTRIAFARRNNGVYQIFTIDAKTGTGLAQITSMPGDAIRPTWSPDGQWIAFAADTGQFRGASNLFAIRVNGTQLTQLTNGDFTVNSPSWGRDGWLYFCAAPPSANFDVWRVRPAMGTGQP